MPDDTYIDLQPGDTLNADQIMALPARSAVMDRDGDTYHLDDNGRWTRNAGNGVWGIPADAAYSYFTSLYLPYTLHSLPGGAVAVGISDLFQQARIALRDRLGTEPSNELVEGTQRLMQSGVMGAEDAARTAVEAQGLGAREVASTFLLVLVEGADASTQFVVADYSTAGLARLRAHAALDALLDQHGISR